MEEFRTLVLYRTSHGSTKKYADWIGDALNADVMEASKKDFANWSFLISRYDMVIMGGNLNERGINGIKDYKAAQAKNPIENVTYFCVGSYPPSEETTSEHLKSNFAEGERASINLFYFRGRLDYIGLGFLEKRMMSGLMKAIEKRYPEDRTQAEAELLEAYYDDMDWSDKTSIQPLVDHVKSFMSPEQLKEVEAAATIKMQARAELEAEAEAEWAAEMQRREALYLENQKKAEEDKIRRMSKKQKAAYLARKAAKAEAEAEEQELLAINEDYEPVDDYSELTEADIVDEADADSNDEKNTEEK